MHFYKYHTFRIRDMKLGPDFVLGLDPFTDRGLRSWKHRGTNAVRKYIYIPTKRALKEQTSEAMLFFVALGSVMTVTCSGVRRAA